MGIGNSQEINKDIDIKGDINIYIFGKINSEDKHDILNYNLIRKIFPEKEPEKDGFIALQDSLNLKYAYKYKKNEVSKENINKKYNAFIFWTKNHQKLSYTLIQHLYEKDKLNKNKNVIIYFGEDNFIIEELNKLSEKSQETIPFLIIINNNAFEYDKKLYYINYIPSITNIIKKVLKQNNNFNKYDLMEHSYEEVKEYIIHKLYRIDLYYNQRGYDDKIDPFNDNNTKIKMHYTIGLLGYSGLGKSTLINLVFNELVSKAVSKGTEVTTKCSEYYLPIKSNIFGKIRFLDFPGVSEQDNYEKIVKPEIEKKISEYKKNKYKINIVLFFIPVKVRVFTSAGLSLLDFLYNEKIKVIFIINEEMKDFHFQEMKNKLKNTISQKGMLSDDFSNVIKINCFQYYDKESRTGISDRGDENHYSRTGLSMLFKKIIEFININKNNYNINDITVDNYNDKLKELRGKSEMFDEYENMDYFKQEKKTEAELTYYRYSALACGTSAISLFVPFIDTFIAVGYQVAMVYKIFDIYRYKTEEYNISDIVLTGGDKIEKNDKKNDCLSKACNAGKSILELEANKQTIKEISNQAIIAGTEASTVRAVTERIVIKQTGKVGSNFGRAIPFIGAGINATINYLTTYNIGKNLVQKFDEEFDDNFKNNKKKQINSLKEKLKALFDIIDQLNNIN